MTKKMKERKMQFQMSGVENAGPENAGPENQNWKMEDQWPEANFMNPQCFIVCSTVEICVIV